VKSHQQTLQQECCFPGVLFCQHNTTTTTTTTTTAAAAIISTTNSLSSMLSICHLLNIFLRLHTVIDDMLADINLILAQPHIPHSVSHLPIQAATEFHAKF